MLDSIHKITLDINALPSMQTTEDLKQKIFKTLEFEFKLTPVINFDKKITDFENISDENKQKITNFIIKHIAEMPSCASVIILKGNGFMRLGLNNCSEIMSVIPEQIIKLTLSDDFFHLENFKSMRDYNFKETSIILSCIPYFLKNITLENNYLSNLQISEMHYLLEMVKAKACLKYIDLSKNGLEKNTSLLASARLYDKRVICIEAGITLDKIYNQNYTPLYFSNGSPVSGQINYSNIEKDNKDFDMYTYGKDEIFKCSI